MVVSLEEYKLDNIRLARLINALEQCMEVDSVRQLRMVNYNSIIATKDSLLRKQSQQLSINQTTIWELKQDILLEKKRKKQWRTISLISLATTAWKLVLTY